MIKSIQIETPPSMKDDRHARRCIITHEDGKQEVIDNSPVGHSNLIRALFRDIPPEDLPFRMDAAFTPVGTSDAPEPPTTKVVDVPAAPTQTTVKKGTYRKRKKSTGLPDA